ncbi:MAG TPA: hypothetical protein VHU19_12320 [Pyrinomonadaceae bacterium]|jgi:hypothetical protein|nr:hypothetical protein [Pyrinomonadaceae bacterium]
MNPRTKAALIGGVVAGLLSAIPVVNYCCCLWAIGGGVLAVFLYVKSTGAMVTPGSGASLGAVTGGIAAVIYLVISLPLNLLIGAAAVAGQMEQMERAGVSIPLSGMALVVVFVVIAAVCVFLFTLLGGVIGAPIFGKGGGAAAPPPPPPGGFGGPGM